MRQEQDCRRQKPVDFPKHDSKPALPSKNAHWPRQSRSALSDLSCNPKRQPASTQTREVCSNVSLPEDFQQSGQTSIQLRIDRCTSYTIPTDVFVIDPDYIRNEDERSHCAIRHTTMSAQRSDQDTVHIYPTRTSMRRQ